MGSSVQINSVVLIIYYFNIYYCSGQGIVNYCHQYTFVTNSSSLQLTREISKRDYAINDKFKSVHCCAKGYRSIEWYKDGRPYPWPGSESSLILYPESANQTIYTQTVERTDAGNYTCLVRNDTHSLWRSIRLTVLDMEDYNGSPLATYEPEDQNVLPGDTTRFFCEAFVGHIKGVSAGDMNHIVTWKRDAQNGSLENLRRFEQRQVPREDNQILGGYLTIKEVQPADYGRYTCSIAVAGQPRMQMTSVLRKKVVVPEATPVTSSPNGILLAVILSCVALGLAVVLYYRLRLRLLLLWKDFFSYGDKNDPKEFDIFICYVTKDTEFAVSELLPALEKRFHYQCCIHQLQPDGCGRLAQLAQVSRRLVLVVSPGLVEQHGSSWTPTSLAHLLVHLAQLHPSTVFVMTQELPMDCASRDLSVALLKTRHIVWPNEQVLAKNSSQFWLRLCLLLPARRPLCSPRQRRNDTTSGQSSDLHLASKKLNTVVSTSHESLEVLV